MRQGLVVQAGPSPLANAFSEFTKAMYTGPGPEERAYKEALAKKAQIEAQQMEQQQAVQQEVIKSIPQLFTAQMLDKPDPNAMGPFHPTMGPQPTMQVPETPEETVNRATPQALELGLKMGAGSNDPIGQMAKLYSLVLNQGGADQVRRGLTATGHMPGPDFAPTAAEGNRIVERNTLAEQNKQIAIDGAKPLTGDQFKAQELSGNWDNLDKLNPLQLKALGAMPSKGVSFSTGPDGGMEFSMGGDDGSLGLTKANTSIQQKNLQANQELKAMVGHVRGMVQKNPSAIGAVGNIQRGAQTAYDVAGTVRNMFGTPEAYGDQLKKAQLTAMRNGLSLRFDKDMHNVVNLHSLMLYKTAEALAGQSGRSVTDNDIKKAEKIVGKVDGWFQSPQAYVTSLDQLEMLADDNIGKAGEMLKSGTVNPIMPSGASGAPPAADTAAPAAPAAGGSNIDPAAAIEAARAAIGKGKSREHVLQRLRQNGIQPPPDL